MKIRCISLWQPWAWLCVATDEQGRAEKQNETRHWYTNYRGLLVIHAAKKWDEENAWLLKLPHFRDAVRRHFPGDFDYRALGFGAAIGVVRLVDCKSQECFREKLSEKELAFGNYSDGRYVWQFTEPRRFAVPIPLRGHQGMWDEEIELALRRPTAREVLMKTGRVPVTAFGDLDVEV